MPEFDTLRALLARVTPGPWATHYTNAMPEGPRLSALTHDDGVVLLHWAPGDATYDDAEFIARSPTVVTQLLAEVDRLTELLG